MSKSKTQLEKTSVNKSKLNKSKKLSAQETCEQLSSLAKQEKWDQKSYQRFTDLIINPESQYELNKEQQLILTEAILSCPSDYRSLVELYLIYTNSEKEIYTLKGIIPKIIKNIISSLKKEDQLEQESTLIEQENLKKWLSAKKQLHHDKKINLCRILITFFLSKQNKIEDNINIILEFFSGLNILSDSEKRLNITEKNKSIINFFLLHNPTETEAERLIKYGLYSQLKAEKYRNQLTKLEAEITKFKNDLVKMQLLCEEKSKNLEQTKEKLSQAKIHIEQKEAELQKEYQLYQQLESSSQAKISQEKNSTINQISHRIEHELKKLERCLHSKNVDNFVENQAIGLKIIQKIKNQLLIEE